ncbi:hypothetical protein [Lysinibacillus irui]|uniref:hypothetical protein n=2 Tax=Lysinibacillus irui TaxID=2998077 RepID=UPI002AD5AD07|nr:hypothetical protein [Lysinibacillus irui]MEA0565259.1 hypothetical protein [Lysinibacillus irui]
MKRMQLVSLIIVNLVLLPIIQLSYNQFYAVDIPEGMFQLWLFPLLILLINVLLWSCRLRITSYIHWTFIYVGAGTSLACYFVWHYSQLIPYPHMPPGEATFELYMRTFLLGLWQLVALFLVNVLTFIMSKIWMSLKNVPKI